MKLDEHVEMAVGNQEVEAFIEFRSTATIFLAEKVAEEAGYVIIRESDGVLLKWD